MKRFAKNHVVNEDGFPCTDYDSCKGAGGSCVVVWGGGASPICFIKITGIKKGCVCQITEKYEYLALSVSFGGHLQTAKNPHDS
ncbi:MAG: hypothetical protein B6D35_11230 [Candidatus Brocadia sp. UTAMX2]|jgi:hypothetical protein|nr:MAG: hypothetical protein B6D35_11230 [Candidatus Brocadia sp. UTAMX2]